MSRMRELEDGEAAEGGIEFEKDSQGRYWMVSNAPQSERRFREKGDYFHKGRFTLKERTQLIDSLNAYIAAAELGEDGYAMLSESMKRSKNSEKVWCTICSVLPNRRIEASQRFLKRYLSSKVNCRGAWIPEEEDILRGMVETKGSAWTEIGRLLNRSVHQVRDKWRELQIKDTKREWTEEENEKLISLLASVCPPGIDAPIKGVMWQDIAAKLDRTAKGCRVHYFEELYRPLVGKSEGWTTRDDYFLARSIADQGCDDESEVNWDSCGVVFPPKEARQRWLVLCKRVIGWREKSHDELATALVQTLKAQTPDVDLEFERELAEKRSRKEQEDQGKVEETSKKQKKQEKGPDDLDEENDQKKEKKKRKKERKEKKKEKKQKKQKENGDKNLNEEKTVQEQQEQDSKNEKKKKKKRENDVDESQKGKRRKEIEQNVDNNQETEKQSKKKKKKKKEKEKVEVREGDEVSE